MPFGGHIFSTATLLAAALAVPGASAQQAYFSATGAFTANGGDHDFRYSQIPDATTADDLRFTTYGSAGGTNAAGDLIAAGPVDSFLELRNDGGTSVGSNDDGRIGFDSLLSWPGVATSGGALPAAGLPGDGYIINVRDLGNNSVGPWALDIEAPASLITLTTNSGSDSRLDSLKFGTDNNGQISTPAFLRLQDGTSTTIADELVVAQTGRGRLDLSNGTLNVNGRATVNAGGGVTVTGFTGQFNANDTLYLNGGALDVNGQGTLTTAGIDVRVGDELSTERARLTVNGNNTTWTANNTVVRIAPFGSQGTVSLINGATATTPLIAIAQDSPTSSTSGILNVQSDADLTAARLELGRFGGNAGSGTVNVNGSGSTLTLTAANPFRIGNGSPNGNYTVNVTDSGTLTTGTGLIDINRNGRLNINTGGDFNANGDINVNGGQINASASDLDLASGKTLTARDGGQVTLTGGSYFVTGGRALQIESGASFSQQSSLTLSDNGGGGTVVVTGDGTTYSSGFLNVSPAGNTGSFTVTDGATATFTDQIRLATNLTTASANAGFTVSAGGTVTVNTVLLGDFDDNVGTANLTVTGPGSTMSLNGGSVLILGSNITPGTAITPGTHTVTVADGGTFSTGTGNSQIRETGTLNINTGGEFKANGNVNVDGGTLNTTVGGFDLAASQTLNVTNDGQVAMTGGSYSLINGRTINLNTGGDLTHTGGNFALDSSLGANLNVAGPGSTFSTTGLLTASGSNPGTLDLQDQAVATLGSLFIGRGGTTADTNGVVNVLSGSTLNLGNLRLGNLDGTQGSGTLTVSGPGSTVNQSGSSTTFIGNVNTAGQSGNHRVTLRDSATFTTGTGATTVNATGELRIESNWDSNNGFRAAQLVLTGDLLINQGGQLSGNGVIDQGTTPGGSITNAGTLATASEVAYFLGGSGRFSTQIDVPYTQTAAGTMTFELADIVEGTGDDQLSSVFLTDGYTLAGEARFIASHPGNPLVDFDFLDLGESKRIISTFGGSTRTGVFDTVAGHILGDGTALAVLYDGAIVEARRSLYGDANLDGFISQADLDAVLLNWGKTSAVDGISWITGDYSGDGFVAQADLDAVLLNWGSGTPPVVNFNAIPEPAAGFLLLGAGAMAVGRRRA